MRGRMDERKKLHKKSSPGFASLKLHESEGGVRGGYLMTILIISI